MPARAPLWAHTAWEDVPRVALVHQIVRRSMLAQGARDYWFDAPHGVRAHAYVAGPRDAPATVLVHGLGDSSHTWFRTLPYLAAAGHRVYALDLYGHGRTPLPRDRPFMRIVEHADCVGALAAEVAVDNPWSLLGHSMGGWIAAKLAARRPAGLSRLVLGAAAGLKYDGMEREAALLRVQSAADVSRLWSAACHRVPWELRILQADVAKLFAKSVVRGFMDDEDAWDLLLEDELARIDVPTTILWGEKDGLVLPELGVRLAKLVPGAALHWIRDCGHAPQLEDPGAFNALIARALAPALAGQH